MKLGKGLMSNHKIYTPRPHGKIVSSDMKNVCIGFTCQKGVMLDLDNITFRKTSNIAEYLLKSQKLEGYIIVKSSKNHYHIVFNKYTNWRKSLMIILSVFKCVEWGIWQTRKGYLTLRISKKKGNDKPKIMKQTGKTDKLIKDYLQVYKLFEEY